MAQPVTLADLPPEVFAYVIDMFEMRGRGPVSELEKSSRRSLNKSIRTRALRSLSLVSDGMRKLAQPLIFSHATLTLVPDLIRCRAEDLIQLIEARPESTTWVKSLHLHLETHPLPDAPVYALIATLLTHLDGLQCLQMPRLYDVVVNAPSQFFSPLTDLRISGIRSGASFQNFLIMLSRCPNLTSLSVGFIEDTGKIEIPKETAPLLTHLRAPIRLATRLVIGRPVEDVIIVAPMALGPRPLCRVSDLEALATGSQAIRKLDVTSTLQWSDGTLPAIAAMFPSIEKLSLYVELSYDVRSFRASLAVC